MPDAWRWITGEIADIVRPAGFKRLRKAFVDLTVPDVPKQIAIERSRWNTPVSRRFALMLSIYLPARDAAGFAADGWKDHYTPVFHKNAGYLWGNEAFLYTVPDILPSEQLSGELRAHLTEHILPFFGRCTSIDAFVEVMDRENERLGKPFFSAGLAVALARLGRTDQSRKYFQQSIGDPEMIRKFAQSYGITL
jgi:hypothetical protein